MSQIANMLDTIMTLSQVKYQARSRPKPGMLQCEIFWFHSVYRTYRGILLGCLFIVGLTNQPDMVTPGHGVYQQTLSLSTPVLITRRFTNLIVGKLGQGMRSCKCNMYQTNFQTAKSIPCTIVFYYLIPISGMFWAFFIILNITQNGAFS